MGGLPHFCRHTGLSMLMLDDGHWNEKSGRYLDMLQSVISRDLELAAMYLRIDVKSSASLKNM